MSTALQAGFPSQSLEDLPHPTIEVEPAQGIPGIELHIFKDPVSGFNFSVQLSQFDLRPPPGQSVLISVTAHLSGQGHVFVNQQPVMRIYSPHFHLPLEVFIKGLNQVTVFLMNHKQQNFTLNGDDIQSTLTLNTTQEHFVLHRYSSSLVGKR